MGGKDVCRSSIDLALEEAYALALEGRVADAMRLLELAESAGSNDRVELTRARCLLASGGRDGERGLALLEALADRAGPSQAQCLLSLARRRHRAGGADGATHLIDPIVDALRRSGIGGESHPLTALLALEARHMERPPRPETAAVALEGMRADGDGSTAPARPGSGNGTRDHERNLHRVAYDDIVGRSPAMQEVFARLDRIISASDPIIVQGETGTGKELVARLIHNRGPRRHREFVVVNCAGMPEALLESEIFGYERGAFTGADRPRAGLYEVAHRGTLLLDEIADMSPRMQGNLLRALESGEVRRLGGREPFHVDVRVVAASNRDLESEVGRGRFRADLYYRLNVLKLELPPLRDRLEDVPLLIERLMPRVAAGRRAPRFTERAMARLTSYTWPGNVRELQNVLRCVAAAGLETVDESDLPAGLWDAGPRVGRGTLRQLEDEAIRRAVMQTGGNKSRAARLLGVDRKTLYVKLRRLGLHLIGLATLLTCGVVAAQTSASFQVTESGFTTGGAPVSSPKFQVGLASTGLTAAGGLVSGPSFSAEGGFTASFAPPGEVAELRFVDATTLEWSPEGSTGDYNLYRGALSDPFDEEFGSCFAPGVTSVTTADAAVPAAGHAFFYLVTARNRLLEEGPKGFASDGTERANPAPCP